MNNVRAFAIHILTASGAALAFLALIFATLGAWTAMFLTLGLALIVDGVDGPLARKFDVAKTLPRWSGMTLDLVVDFLTYVFVPAYAIAVRGLMPLELAMVSGVLIVVTGALYFADGNMKTSDHRFRGFPAVWNVVAFYLFVLVPPPLVTAATIAILAVLTFTPVKFLHPLRVAHWRILTIAVLLLWSVLALVTLWRDLMPGPWITAALCLIALYVIGVGAFAPSEPTDVPPRPYP